MVVKDLCYQRQSIINDFERIFKSYIKTLLKIWCSFKFFHSLCWKPPIALVKPVLNQMIIFLSIHKVKAIPTNCEFLSILDKIVKKIDFLWLIDSFISLNFLAMFYISMPFHEIVHFIGFVFWQFWSCWQIATFRYLICVMGYMNIFLLHIVFSK